MKLIKDFISKPSEAVQLMIDGLRNQSKREDFSIDMGSYGDILGDFCIGCAATCALQQMSGVNFMPNNIGTATKRAMATDILENEVDIFEDAIDCLRTGNIGGFEYQLSRVIEIKNPIPVPNIRFELRTWDWERHLPLVELYVEQLKAAGL